MNDNAKLLPKEKHKLTCTHKTRGYKTSHGMIKSLQLLLIFPAFYLNQIPFSPGTVQAQTKEMKSSSLGTKAGLNVAWLAGADSEPRIGYHIGIWGNLPLSNHWHLQPEIYYSLQGSEIPVNKYSIRLNYHYFNMPILLQYRNRSYFFLTGPQLGVLYDAKLKYISRDKNLLPQGQEKADVSAQVNKIDIALVFGIGFQVGARLSLEPRFNIGLSNTAANTSEEGEYIPNRNFQLSLN